MSRTRALANLSSPTPFSVLLRLDPLLEFHTNKSRYYYIIPLLTALTLLLAYSGQFFLPFLCRFLFPLGRLDSPTTRALARRLDDSYASSLRRTTVHSTYTPFPQSSPHSPPSFPLRRANPASLRGAGPINARAAAAGSRALAWSGRQELQGIGRPISAH